MHTYEIGCIQQYEDSIEHAVSNDITDQRYALPGAVIELIGTACIEHGYKRDLNERNEYYGDLS